MSEAKEVPPIHQWTHTGDRVLLVKCVNPDGTSHNDFKWPLTVGAECKSPVNSKEPTCESGGLFGWSWGIGVGVGKDPNAMLTWIVFSAPPSDVVGEIGGELKAKAIGSVKIEYVGSQAGAMAFTVLGRIGWIEARSEGSASATGERGSASATGGSGSASATGWSGSASATGGRGSASATGESGSASATGWSGSASATGERGSASATGERGSASATGERGSASATGWSGSASATGWSGSASATGESGSASATGERGSASATGERGSASATGGRDVVATTGEYATVEVSATGIAACVGERVKWKVRKGAILVVRWEKGHKLFTSSKLKNGDVVLIQHGKIVKEFTT